ncbi:S-adenosyl-L-methionine-dependent methyltransferases superfamily protein [Tanacetum coccineum]
MGTEDVEDYRRGYRPEVHLRAMVLWTIYDFPARSNLSGWSGLRRSEILLENLTGFKSGSLARLPTAILITLLLNDKSKDTQRKKKNLKRLGIRSGLWLDKPKLGSARSAQDSQHYLPDVLWQSGRFLCNLELIYPPAFFDIMVSLGYPFTLEALEGGPIHPRWMFPFERFMKMLKDNDLGVSATGELFTLACGPTPTPISVNSCVVNGVRFVVHSSDECHTTQNSGICSPGGKDGEMYYSQLQESLKFSYFSFKVMLFRVKWFDTSNEGRKVKHLVLRNNMTQILTKEEDPDVIHFDNSSDLPLSTSLNDLDKATLHIDGQSTKVDAPPDIIDLHEDDDISDDEDALPRDLADSDDEDFVNVDDDDGVEVMSVNVARGHGGDGGGDDRPPTPVGCFANRGKGTRKPNLGGRKAGRLHTRQETRNLGLKKITDDKGPVPIRFEWDDKKTLMPLGDHLSHWSNYLGELIKEIPLYYPSWQKVPAERKVAILTKIGTQFDLTPHMQSQRWTYINAGIQQHLQKLYNTNKASLKAAHWVINLETRTYDVESIRQRHPQNITQAHWDAHIAFWNDPKNQARAAQNGQNRAKNTVVCRRDPGHLLAFEIRW